MSVLEVNREDQYMTWKRNHPDYQPRHLSKIEPLPVEEALRWLRILLPAYDFFPPIHTAPQAQEMAGTGGEDAGESGTREVNG